MERSTYRHMTEQFEKGISRIFERILKEFTQIDIFSKETSPTCFLVYAHDSPTSGNADASRAQQLIEWLKTTSLKVFADRSQFQPWYDRENGAAGFDILRNQFCLLPKLGTQKSVYDVNSVDKVIICCSEVLQTYCEDKRMEGYTKAIVDFYLKTEKNLKTGAEIEEFKEELAKIVKKHDGMEGFHHVLTEISFLQIRSIKEKRNHGMIPVLLNGDGISYLPFFQKEVPVWPAPKSGSNPAIPELQIRHEFFFKLLSQIFVDSNREIDAFKQCYQSCVTSLSLETGVFSDETLENMISREVCLALNRVHEYHRAAIRTAPKKDDFEVAFDLRGIPQTNHFTGRESELNMMKDQLMPGENLDRRKTCIIHGLGGMGKTQLAIEYAILHKNHYTSYFWLDGKTEESLIQSLMQLVSRLPEGHISTANMQEIGGLEESRKRAQEVLKWFALKGNTKWLLVYDNIDRTSYGEQRLDKNDDTISTYDITRYFPKGNEGSIIITTRLQRLRHLGKEIYLSRLDMLHSLILLEKHSGRSLRSTSGYGKPAKEFHSDDWDPDAIKLVKRLGNLPLALAFAGSYLRKLSLVKYFNLYEKSWEELHETMNVHDYTERTIITTWQISFDEIARRNTGAAKLLQLWGYFDNHDLWYELLCWNHFQKAIPSWLQTIKRTEISFMNTIDVLLEYSMIEQNSKINSYSMHAVVHDWIRESINKANNKELLETATTTLGLAAPNRVTRHFVTIERRLLPHVTRWSKYFSQVDKSSETVDLKAYLAGLNGIGLLYSRQQKLVQAQEILLRALSGSEDFKSDNEVTFDIINNLGILYKNQGKLAKAEEIYQRALAGCKKAFGLDHPATLDIINNLGVLYFSQGNLPEAEKMYQRVLAGRKKAFGLDHPATLDIINNLGVLYFSQGNLPEAEKMYQRALAGLEKAFGLDHPATLNIINNLGVFYNKQGKLAEAEGMYQRALAGCEKAFGLDHPATLNIINNLGVLYKDQKKLTEAEKMYQQALAGREKAFGLDHPATLDIINNVGVLYNEQGKLAEAEEMYQRALKGYKEVFDDGHPDLERVRRNMSALQDLKARLSEATGLDTPQQTPDEPAPKRPRLRGPQDLDKA